MHKRTIRRNYSGEFGTLALCLVSLAAMTYPQDTSRTERDTLSSEQARERDSSDFERVEFRTLPNNAFGVGERLVLDVGFGFIIAGEAVMEIPDYDYHRDRKCYRIQFRVNSLPFFSTFYKVEDRYLSLMDVDGLFPWRFEQHIREGGYVRDFSAEFDHVKLVANTSEGEYPIPRYVHDVVSAFYFTRTIDFTGFRPGQRVHLQNFYKDSTYQLDVKFRGKQTIEVPAGTFRCIVIEPLVKEGGLFKSEGSILVWLTDDERKVPIKVMSKIIIGSITAELREYSGIVGPISAKESK
jgi:hypothetical protein